MLSRFFIRLSRARSFFVMLKQKRTVTVTTQTTIWSSATLPKKNAAKKVVAAPHLWFITFCINTRYINLKYIFIHFYFRGAVWLVGIIIIGLTFCYCSKQKCKKKITPGESELEMRENSRRCAASAPPLSIISGSDLRPNDDLPTYEEAVAQKKDLTIRWWSDSGGHWVVSALETLPSNVNKIRWQLLAS